MLANLGVPDALGLELQHAGDELEAVLGPVIDLFEQDLLVRQRLGQPAVIALTLYCHAQDVGGSL
jgi:hypothetical protein